MRRPVREVRVAPLAVRRTVARTPSSLRSKTQPGSLNGCAVSFAFIGSPLTAMAGSVPAAAPSKPMRRLCSATMADMREDPAETEAAEAEVNAEPAFEEGDQVWVHDADGNRHPGTFVGMNEAAGWF